jgi:hypothetical protein
MTKRQHLPGLQFALLIAICFIAPARADEPQQPVESTEIEKSEKAPAAPVDNRMTALTSSLVLKVINANDARADLKASLKPLGGYPAMVTDDAIVFRLPHARLQEALDIIASQGMMLEKSIEREDLTLQIHTLEGQLKTRHDVLARLRTFFDGADFRSTLEIETNMLQLVQEIEHYKGQLRWMTDRTRFATIRISFSFENRDRIVYTRSPFDWLNSVSLGTVTEDF